MTAKLNLIGKRVGRLTVVGEAPSETWASRWLCLCDCGNTVVRHRASLQRVGATTSCGCSKKEPNAGQFKPTHKATPRGEMTPEKRLYRIWSTIKQRTQNPKAHGYERYGGAGIALCEKWQFFEGFADDMGLPPTAKHTVDRIDPALGYSKENCRWATYTEQNRRRKNTVFVEFDGERVPLGELVARFGGVYKTVYMRVTRYGWPLRRALGLE